MSGRVYPQLYDGQTGPVDSYKRQESGSALNQADTSSAGAALVVAPGEWTEVHVPSSATQGTVTKTAPGIGKRLVITGIHATIATAATEQIPLLVELLEGATRKMAWKVACPANGMAGVALTKQTIVLAANTACTLRFSGAGVAASEQAVTLCGHVAE
jgi:hypothetical protein